MLRATCHSKEDGWIEVKDVTTLSELRKQSGNLIWAETDVASLAAEDIALIADEFSLPPLAVEDAVHPRQRPKLELYGGQIFVVMHQLDEIDEQLEATQIAAFVGDTFVLVIHAGASRLLDEAKKRWTDQEEIERGPAGLLHILVDVVVDDYQLISDELEDDMEDLEDIALEHPNAPLQRQLYAIKQQVARLRRYVLPAERLLDWALDPDSHRRPFTEETAMRFRDVHDHLLRIIAQVRNIDDLAQAVIDLTRAEQAQLLNENSRRLSAWAAIFAVGTLIAGIYGMNFRLVPRDQTLFGFWFAIALIVVLSVGLWAYFRRKKWL
ncbi:MAG: magnesium transporter CorA family protein [Actinomycetota bacterium]|nr:magnesium transporter CorA family protein [Actinomycetota bacterium]